MIHELKIEKEYFEKIACGLKPYELRYNDRNYQIGDFLALNEVEKVPAPAKVGCMNSGGAVNSYTGRCMMVQIIDIYKEDKFSMLKEGTVILSVLPCYVQPDPAKAFEGSTVYDNKLLIAGW